MSQDMFIKMAGIDGESLDAKHQNEIQVLSWNWQIKQTANMHSGSGGGSGKANVSDFVFDHYIDKASPNLMKYCLAGSHIDNIVFTVRKAGGNPLEYLVFTFTDAIITQVGISGSQEDEARPRERVSFSFTKVSQQYVMQNKAGNQSGAIVQTYDIKANQIS